MLNGYKTYLVTVATLMYAIGGGIAGYIDWSLAVPLILAALGLGAVRSGITHEAL